MKKILQAIVMFAVAYFAVYQFFSYQSKINFNYASIPPEGEKQNKGINAQIRELSFGENFIANILIKLSESEKGGKFLLRLIRPIGIAQDKATWQTNNTNYLDTVFNIQRQSPIDTMDAKATVANNKVAYCGAEVVIDYQISKGQILAKQEQSFRLQLGQGILLALENIIIGMHEGQTLSAHIPYWYAGSLQEFMSSNEEKGAGLQLNVKLIKVISPEIKNIRIFDDLVSLDEPILCGNPVSLNLKISKINGQLIFQGPLDYNLGEKNYPLIFSYALFNKPLSSNRVAIVPTSLLKNAKAKLGKMAEAFKYEEFKREEFVLLEF